MARAGRKVSSSQLEQANTELRYLNELYKGLNQDE